MTKVNKKLTKKQEALLWRRNKVLQMSMAGMSQMDIADALKISQGSVSILHTLRKSHADNCSQ
jgi:DNA-binding CsgD family transcriptional regulator